MLHWPLSYHHALQCLRYNACATVPPPRHYTSASGLKFGGIKVTPLSPV